MQSDVMLQSGNDVLIIDAKFYSHITQSHFDRETVRSAHLYQIFTYVKNQEHAFGDAPHGVSGLLLYARTDEAVQPDEEYVIQGSRIGVKTLDMNRPFNEIRLALDGIVQEHFPHQ